MFGTIAVTLVSAFLISQSFSLYKNYAAAQKIGLPIVVGPVDPMNPLWILFVGYFFQPLLELLPGDLGLDSKLNSAGWRFKDKNATHERLGKVFIHVNPTRNEIQVADPNVSHQILARIKEFPKPEQSYSMLNVFGRSLLTTNGDEWKRHRKIAAPCFNERVSSLVWEEGIRQADAMLSSFLSSADGVMQNINDVCAIVALHVLCYAGFGTRQDYGTGVSKVPQGHTLNYRDALCEVLSNMLLAFVFPVWLLSLPIAPKSYRKLSTAMSEFKQYMEEMVIRQRSASDESSEHRTSSLTSTLIRASQEDKASTTGAAAKGLSDSELYGNMFIFNLAGHDTTANTMSYALALMAIDPAIQIWVAEEVQRVFAQNDRSDYEKCFPQLKRVQALMLETLRLYPPVTWLPKWTNNQPTRLTVPIPSPDNNEVENDDVNNEENDAYDQKETKERQKEILIPASTYLLTNVMSLHTNADHWSPDPLTFRPQRWISKSTSTTTTPTTATHPSTSPEETLITPQPNTFIPWAAGPRNCVGIKFSQVEFVSVISTLVSRSRLEAVLPPALREKLKGKGMDRQDLRSYAKNRLQNLLEDSVVNVTLTISKPKEVWLKWRAI